MRPRAKGPAVGLLEWFRPGEFQQVERVLADLEALGVQHLRTGVSWADWHLEWTDDWYDWLLGTISRKVEVLPCFTFTPPSLGVLPKTSSPPQDPKAYADFLDVVISRCGQCFEWVELWNEPNNLSEWDWTLDASWETFAAMVGGAGYWARQRGKKTILGGMCPADPHWLDLMGRRGVLEHCEAVGIHGFPASFELSWDGWKVILGRWTMPAPSGCRPWSSA